ncbi:mitochondrial thiamine pyrophosphate transporter [Entophlyctis sp. JEL0112]|nr:mitochondrial thiamine pyrophosphate transporter [Entophlyctis sp. JEL0112]
MAAVSGQPRATPPLSKTQNAVSGAIAGVVARVVIAPIDVVKIRFQLQTIGPSKQPKYRGIIQSMALITREEGFRALWKGNWPAEYLYLSYGAVQFLVYDEILKLFPEHTPKDIKTILSGAMAGSAATVATYPFDLLRTRFAMQGSQKVYSSMLDAYRQIISSEGVAGFYRGIWPSVLQIAPYMGLLFGVQDILSKQFAKNERLRIGGLDHFLSGAIAGIVGKTAVMPFDVVRKRMQVQGPNRKSYVITDIPKYSGSGFLRCARQIMRVEGYRALYKGLWPSILKSAPNSAVTFWVVGECRKVFRVINEQK